MYRGYCELTYDGFRRLSILSGVSLGAWKGVEVQRCDKLLWEANSNIYPLLALVPPYTYIHTLARRQAVHVLFWRDFVEEEADATLPALLF